MKGLILKDLYNITHNSKTTLLVLFIFALTFIPSSGIEGYVAMCTIMCSIMIVTTFSYDTYSNWNRYALVMPISRKALVAGKFVVLYIFSLFGIAFGVCFGLLISAAMNRPVPEAEGMKMLLCAALGIFSIAVMLGSLMIPLIIKFGVEKARVFFMVSYLIPAAICFLGYRLLGMAGITVTDEMVMNLIYCSPVIAIVWNFVTYKISCTIFERQEI